MKTGVFHNELINNQLKDQGYAIFDGFNSGTVAFLRELYRKEKPFFWRRPVYCNAFQNKRKKNYRINDELVRALSECPKLNLDAVEIVGGCFISKMGNRDNEVGMHQDWTITDESQAESYVLWIPLVDTSVENGTMAVLPGSHRKFKNTLRSLSVRSLYIPLRSEYADNYKVIELKAGQALIYSSALFHGSFSNTSSQERIAITTVLLPKGTQRVYYHYDEKSGKAYRVRMPHNFHLDFQPRLPKVQLQEELEVLEVVDQLDPMLTEHEVMESVRA